MRRSISLILALAAATLVVLVLGLLLARFFGKPATPQALHNSALDPIEQARKDVARISRYSSPIDRNIMLPARGTPLAGVLNQLDQAAKDGSSKAACRIAQDIARCRDMAASLDVAEMLSGVPALPGRKESISEQLLKQSEDDGFCANVPAEVMQSGYEYQKAAAGSGNESMQRWLLTSPALDRQNFLAQLDDWKDYRQRADTYVKRALQRRNGDDLALLLAIYAPSNVTTIRPPYRVDDRPTFLALMNIAEQHELPVPTEIKMAAKRLHNSINPKEVDLIDGRTKELQGEWKVAFPPKLPHQLLAETGSDDFCR